MMIRNKLLWLLVITLTILLLVNIKIWNVLLRKEEVARVVLSYLSEKYLKYNLTLPQEGGEFVVKIETSAPQKYFYKVMVRAFPEYKVVYTTKEYPSPHLIYRGIIPSEGLFREFKNLVPYFVGNHEPNYFTSKEYRVTGKPFMVANDHIQFPYDNTHEYIPLVALSYQGIQDRLFEHQTNFGNYKKIRNKGIAYVNSQCHPQRDRLFFLLKERIPDKIHALGRCPINYTKASEHTIPSRAEGWDKLGSVYKDYNFVFAMENAKMRGYVSEKIINAYDAGSIPIYWGDSQRGDSQRGDSQIAKRFFNPNSYIDVDSFNSLEEAAEYIVSIINSKEKTEKYLNTPMFIDRHSIDPLLLIEQEKLTPESEKIIERLAKKLRSSYFNDIKNRKNYSRAAK